MSFILQIGVSILSIVTEINIIKIVIAIEFTNVVVGGGDIAIRIVLADTLA